MTEERYTPPRPFHKIQSDVIRAISFLRTVASTRLKSGEDQAKAELCAKLFEELTSYTMALHDRLVDLRFLGETEETHTEPTVRVKEVTCPRAKSDMTPCYLKQGYMCIAYTSMDTFICVGCEWTIERINAQK